MNAVTFCNYWFNEAECVRYVFDSGYFQYVYECVFVEHYVSTGDVQNTVNRVKSKAIAVEDSLYGFQFPFVNDATVWDAASRQCNGFLDNF